MEFLTGLLENSTFPWFTAFVLGLMTAISPCPLATNITAVGFISKDIENRNRVFANGLFYTLGRAISYTLIPLVIFMGADQLKFSGFFQAHGEKILGPTLVLLGLLMLGVLRFNFPGLGRLNEKLQRKTRWGYFDALLLGIVFAMAFCPYSGVLFFGMLVPLTVASSSGLYLPVVFALATGIPVILFAWLIAFAFSEVGRFYDKIRTFEQWFRRVVAIGFIGIGIYYLIKIWL
jgi:cytochrome c-type biogenesis protein